MKLPIRFLLLLPLLATPLGVRAQSAVDAARGLVLARQICSECHAVLAQEFRSPDPKAPTFAALSSAPGMTATALTVSLTTPHAGMPMFRLDEAQRSDLIAYILGLKRQPGVPGR